MRWLGEHPYLLIPLGVLVVYVVLRAGFSALRTLGAPSPSERAKPQAADMEPYDVRYGCQVCGVEMRLTLMPDDDHFQPPRHCGEEMFLVVREGS